MTARYRSSSAVDYDALRRWTRSALGENTISHSPSVVAVRCCVPPARSVCTSLPVVSREVCPSVPTIGVWTCQTNTYRGRDALMSSVVPALPGTVPTDRPLQHAAGQPHTTGLSDRRRSAAIGRRVDETAAKWVGSASPPLKPFNRGTYCRGISICMVTSTAGV